MAAPAFLLRTARCMALSIVIAVAPPIVSPSVAATSVDVDSYLASYHSFVEQGKIADQSRITYGKIAKIPPASLSDAKLGQLFKALDFVSFYIMDAEPARSLMAAADELSRRRLISPAQAKTVVEALSAARLQGEASAFAQKHGLVADSVDAKGIDSFDRAVVSFDGNRAVAGSLTLPSGGYVLVVGVPACHFAENAAVDIESDPRLAQVMAKFSRWIVPQARGITTSDLLDWNKRHGAFTYSAIWQANQWPELNDWASPTFYFFRDGKLVDQHFGWRRPGAAAILEQKLRAIGIALPAAAERPGSVP